MCFMDKFNVILILSLTYSNRAPGHVFPSEMIATFGQWTCSPRSLLRESRFFSFLSIKARSCMLDSNPYLHTRTDPIIARSRAKLDFAPIAIIKLYPFLLSARFCYIFFINSYILFSSSFKQDEKKVRKLLLSLNFVIFLVFY